ncbi:uncharacterized protein LOC131949828 isoform X2 [Physella acuta]|uniref:uncharacterized protein LOC131949828 isoform X2 n=1 Tax=Physella acuta TaxID=109671 RepID=UPI0027DE8D35|nr:uncharacterized protein LOC131949828 isoform X2 [Physella acuta]XP_059167814.1 uncharacterized protein LOC131949828 isoform X2 [Physella acuta]XP_059167815.1 uncharacterized protein LOC131949828 isoform X2 [Physella acuta]XP_059167816.1 uncharacterized protein LOC131949828 isoform X2 [Physella acuta]
MAVVPRTQPTPVLIGHKHCRSSGSDTLDENSELYTLSPCEKTDDDCVDYSLESCTSDIDFNEEFQASRSDNAFPETKQFQELLKSSIDDPNNKYKAETVLIHAFKLIDKEDIIKDDVLKLVKDKRLFEALYNCVENQVDEFNPNCVQRTLMLRSGIEYLCENVSDLKSYLSDLLPLFNNTLECWKNGDYIDYEYVMPDISYLKRPAHLHEKHSWWLEL